MTPAQQGKLRVAQRAWIAWRNANCEAEKLTGGTMDLIAGSSCFLSMTVRRTIELEELANDPRLGG